MALKVDFTRLTTSWTKYDIVQVMEVIYSAETIEKFKRKEANIDEPILRSFLGIKSLEDPTPDYWIEIQNYPKVKKLFALFATIFTHGAVVKEFAEQYAGENMKGVFMMKAGKQYTNIRSALIEAGAAPPLYRRMDEVPYDFSPIFQNQAAGRLFKKVLEERITRLTRVPVSEADFLEICIANNFHQALSLTQEQFVNWIQGDVVTGESGYIKSLGIDHFFSVEDVHLDFNGSKEIYLLGENGDGKSLILMAAYLAFNGNYVMEETDQEKTGKATDILRNNSSVMLLGTDEKGTEYHPRKNVYLNNFFAYGTHRGRVDTDNPEEYGFMSLFDSGQTLNNPVSWLKNQKMLGLEQRLDKMNIIGEIKELPYSFAISTLQNMFYDLLEKHVTIEITGTEVLFKEKNAVLTFDQLSEGYRSILIFVSDLLYRLSKLANYRQDISDFTGVVLVDEIDLHLHPKWQRVIVKKLRDIFPKVQFIFTTHSPTIIQGASDDAIIYRVYRNQEGKTKVTEPTYRSELNNLMINTLITSPLFGLEDSRLDPDEKFADTSETYLLYRINQKVEETLAEQKKAGKTFFSKKEIDELILQAMNEELNKK